MRTSPTHPRSVRTPFLLLALVAGASACSEGSKKSSGGGAAPAPATVEDALGRLSSQDAASYALWKNGTTKECDAKALLSGKAATGAAPIDSFVPSERFGKKSLIALPGGSWALVEPGAELAGTSESRVQGKVEVNGSSRGERDVRVTRAGGTCEVFIFGKSVYKTRLVSSIQVVASRDVGAPSTPVTGRVAFPERADKAFEVRGPWNLAAEGPSARATPDTLAKVAKSLNVDVTSVRKESTWGAFVSPSGASGETMAFGAREPGIGSSSLLFAPSVAAGGETAWQEVVKSFPVVTHVRTAPWRKEHPAALWSWEGTLSTTIAANEATVAYAAPARVPTIGGFDDAAAVRCHKARLAVFPRDAGAFLPGATDAFGSCGVLAATSMTGALLALDRESVLARFRSSPRPQGGFAGWDTVLLQWMEGLWAEKGIDAIPAQLGTDVEVVNAFTSHARTLQGALGGAEGSVTAKAWLAGAVRPLAGRWAFEGATANADGVVSTLKVAARVYDALPEESGRLVDELARESMATPQKLDVLSALDAAFLARVGSYRASMGTLGAEALARERFGSFRDSPVAPETLTAWELHWSAAKVFRDKELAAPATFAASRDSDVKDWVTRALEEGWSGADFSSLDAFAALARKKLACDQRKSVVEALECIDDDLFSRRDGAFLAPAYGDRYVRASKSFLEALELAKDEMNVRYDIQDAFWGPVWADCDAAAFDAKVSALLPRVRTVVSSGFPQKFDAIRALQEHLEDCR